MSTTRSERLTETKEIKRRLRAFPALLEAAKAASKYLDRGTEHTGAFDGNPMCDRWNGNACNCLQGQLRTAISIAEGRTV